ncbi:hypothetical protein RY831_29475 [Noviherbaspirillum sp. CPCC 100848]|uniref:Peptidase C39 domain-containing protein n=1 Tax=Noviherbaspirillum album TaxID=3080276 RepID=A0ABU6JHZ2_9BURK|nr:hypothetical protein [Noviherbaspirillum sp. CPCC 100848]MEC4723292.1 hypothetical protein [Noviherbaspirillum sp. CPCC 100848]
MASTPSSPSMNHQAIQPAFVRVSQRSEWDDAFACIATITGKSLDDVYAVATDKLKFPKHPPRWITESMINRLLAHCGYSSTVYKPVAKLADIPDVAIILVEWSNDMDVGRHAVFVRDRRTAKKPQEYVLDPAYWIEPRLHVRIDIKNLAPAWYIGVVPMNHALT